jgi:predicted dehydrogenase/threonine dehydrogenase-like Zn-dependent dehydrogenase
MKAVLTSSKTGEIGVHDIPAPEALAGGILVRTHFSVISSGTERAKVEMGEKSLLGKAMARPDLVRQVLDYARIHGMREAYHKVRNRLEGLAPLGYSCSGVVLAAGEGVSEFRAGDRVACGGVGYANHSETNFIPRNLAVAVPENVSLEQAAITTIGTIAMQGLRQAEVRFGETLAVIGAGLVGVLTVQLARAAGCRVVAIDINPDRVRRAMELGAHLGFHAGEPQIEELVKGFSRYGADAAVITAASHTSEPLELATRLLRDRGRIVVVGDVGLNVARASLYEKELSVVMSRSYGPGRYDAEYEEKGVDYPLGYVRWTEKRNMEAFVDYLAMGAINVAPLMERQCAMEEVPAAYEEIREGRAYTVLIRYTQQGVEEARAPSKNGQSAARPRLEGALRVGCIGAGGFARDVIFPQLRRIRCARLEAVASASGVGAESARRTAGFRRACAPDELIEDPNVDAVFVATRHDSHAGYALKALTKNKPVFIEKPMCGRREEFEAIQRAYAGQTERGTSPFVMVGYNRRFAPLTEKVKEFFEGRREAMAIQIRVNAGYIPPDHWVQQASGGRIVGELCHFVDWARFIVGRQIVTVSAGSMPDGLKYSRDNISTTLGFEDGSIASVLYLANGDKTVPKEYFEVFCEGRVARLEDFRALELSSNGKKRRFKTSQDKGHQRELELTIQAMSSGGASPIAFEELREVAEITFRIEEALGGLRGSSLAQAAGSEPVVEEIARASSAKVGD